MPHTPAKTKRQSLQSFPTNDVAPQPIDTDRLSAAMTAALKILRPGTNAKVKVSKKGGAK